MLPIAVLMAQFASDPTVDEIITSGTNVVTIIRGATIKAATIGGSPDGFNHTLDIQEFTLGQGVRLDPHWPSAGGTYLSAHRELFRWHTVIPPISSVPLFAIRRHRFADIKLADFADATTDFRKRLAAIWASQQPLLIYGPTGSGKSTALMAILQELCREERLGILEEFPELPRLSGHWFSLQCCPPSRSGSRGISMRDLFVEALRLRPDRLVLGEIRSEEAGQVFCEAITSGHSGCLSTIHARDKSDLLERFRNFSKDLAGGFSGKQVWGLGVVRGEPPRLADLHPI